MNFKLFALVILSVASVALAGPATTGNKADNTKEWTDIKTPAAETLKQWCKASEMSQPELTESFKRLVGQLKQSPSDELTDAVVINGHFCQATQEADMNANDLVKDVYMDALSACDKRECMKQLIKCIDSGKVDKVRANYYMTRLAVNDNKSANEQKDMIQELSESFVQSEGQQQSLVSKAIQRQKMFAVTANLAKQIEKEMGREQNWEQLQSDSKQTVERVVRAINDRFVKPVTQSDVEEYKQKSKTPTHLAEKIAERNAALKAIANIPGYVIAHIDDVEQTLIQLAKNKQELSTVRQSAIEALEQNEKVEELMTEIALQQHDEPTEVRVAAYRCLITTAFAGAENDSKKQQDANEIVTKVLKYVESQQNQQQDEQFCLYVISHLNNLCTSENPDHAAIKDAIHANKQHHMQISLLNKKFKHQLQKFGKSSRNYQLDQTFDKAESGLIVESDIVFGQELKQTSFLPKLVRVNVSLPILGKTVNVVEVAIRQDNMDKEFIKALRPLQDAKFNTETIEKVVGELKQQVQQQQQQQSQSGVQQVSEADFAIKVDGCTVVYVCADDMKTEETLSRQTRSIRSTSALEDILEQLKRNQLSFNRGFHFDINKRLAGVLDVEAHLIGGLLFDSRINTHRGAQDFEVQIQMEPRVSFEALVGPAASAKRLLQRASTQSAIGMRLRYKENELVDVQIDLPMEEMELFKVESQMVEKNFELSKQQLFNTYSYLDDSIWGNEDIYSPEEHTFAASTKKSQIYDSDKTQWKNKRSTDLKKMRKMKRDAFEGHSSSWANKLMPGKKALFWQSETSEFVARATGLRSKVNIVASPKDLTFLASWIVKKYEPSMQGYRVQIQEQKQGSQQNQYLVTLSTPGSQVERTMQIRLSEQLSAQRTVLKTELQSRLMSGSAQIELIHDGRQYAIKVETASSRGALSYKLEAGIQRSNLSGKIATTYKPYLLVQAPELARPIQIQGLISYQQSPKTVITYELKTQDSGKFVQGKFILQKRASAQSANKRNSWNRRSMQSPFELMLQDDVTMTNEIVAQWKDLALKQNIVIESEGYSVNFDIASQYKTKHTNKPEDSRLTIRWTYSPELAALHVEHRCSLYPVHNYRYDYQYDLTKNSGFVKFVSKSTNIQGLFDYQNMKVDWIIDSEGRRIAAAQFRANVQGNQYQWEGVAQYKNQPWAKISAKVPAMLMNEPAEFFKKSDRLTSAVVEFDGVVFPTQFQIAGKLDCQKNEMHLTWKAGSTQFYELKSKYDERTANLVLDVVNKDLNVNYDGKLQAKINIPGLIEAITLTKSSSWNKNSALSWVPSSMKSVDSSEIAYSSRDTQWKVKLVPRDELTLTLRGPRIQHQSRLSVEQDKVWKFKAESNYDDGRQCNVDASLDAHQKIAYVKASTKQSQCQVVANWPQKKIDLTLDVDGVRVFSHQARFDRSDKFINFDTNVDYYQQPYLRLSGKVPEVALQSWGGIRYASGPSEFNLITKPSQLKIRYGYGKLRVFVQSGDQEHDGQFDMTNGLNMNLKSKATGKDGKYDFQVEVSQPQKRTMVKLTCGRKQIKFEIDLIRNKVDLIAEEDGNDIVTVQSEFVKDNTGRYYKYEMNIHYRGAQWARFTGKCPTMLIDDANNFFQNLDRISNANVEIDGVVYPYQLKVNGYVDFRNKRMLVQTTQEDVRGHGQLKIDYEQNTGNIIVNQMYESNYHEIKTNARINLPGLWITFVPSWKQGRFPRWAGRVSTSEINFDGFHQHMSAKLVPKNYLDVKVDGNDYKHISRVDLKANNNIFKLYSKTEMKNKRHCEAKATIDFNSNQALIEASWKRNDMTFNFDLPGQKINLVVKVNGERVVNHEALLVRDGKFFTINSRIEYKNQPFAHVQAKIPTIYFMRPMSILDRRNALVAEIKYQSRNTELSLRYDPRGDLVVFAKAKGFEHRSLLASAPNGALRVNTSSQWNDGTSYAFDKEISSDVRENIYEAITKPENRLNALESLLPQLYV